MGDGSEGDKRQIHDVFLKSGFKSFAEQMDKRVKNREKW